MNTNERFVITISRELGSGGHTVGQKLAEKLGVRFCDKEVIQGLVKEFNLTPTAIERMKGQKKNWFADFVKYLSPGKRAAEFSPEDGIYGKEYNPDVTTDDIFLAEREILLGLAEESSCVIAGRIGFAVLKDHPNKANFFITASREHRIERVMRKQGLDRAIAEEVIDEVDKGRSNYVKRYAGVDRYDARNYDLVINMDNLTEDEAVDLILKYINSAACGRHG